MYLTIFSPIQVYPTKQKDYSKVPWKECTHHKNVLNDGKHQLLLYMDTFSQKC